MKDVKITRVELIGGKLIERVIFEEGIHNYSKELREVSVGVYCTIRNVIKLEIKGETIFQHVKPKVIVKDTREEYVNNMVVSKEVMLREKLGLDISEELRERFNEAIATNDVYKEEVEYELDWDRRNTKLSEITEICESLRKTVVGNQSDFYSTSRKVTNPKQPQKNRGYNILFDGTEIRGDD